jgi:putative membrane protein
MEPKGEKYFLNLKNRMFKAPNFAWTSLVIIIVILIFELFARLSLLSIVLLLILPFILVIILDYFFIKLYKFFFPVNRISLLNEITFFICFVIFIILYAITRDLGFSILFSFSISPFIRFIFYSPFLDINKIKYNIISYNYVLGLAILYYIHNKDLIYLVPLLLSGMVFIITARLFLRFLISDFVKEYNDNPLNYVGTFVNYMSTQAAEDMKSLSKFMQKMYSIKEIPLSFIVFKANNKNKAVFLFPYVHPGPFGEVGCSNFQYKLKNMMKDVSDNIFIFHTSTTHDDNCGGDEDIEHMNRVIKENVTKLSFEEKGSGIKVFETDIRYQAQLFGHSLILSLSPAKYGFDDIDFDLGMKIIRKLRRGAVRDIAIVDSHNSFDPHYTPLKDLDNNKILELKKALSTLKADKSIEVGAAQKYENLKSLGPLGISVAVIKAEDELDGYVLYDGNNVIKGLREKLAEKTKDRLNNIVVASTDNHVVNIKADDMNPVGNREELEEIITITDKLIDLAIKDLEPAKTASKTVKLKVHVAGKGYIDNLTEITKKIMKKVKTSIGFALLGIAFAILIFVYFKVLFI